jgi:hypothetical protein
MVGLVEVHVGQKIRETPRLGFTHVARRYAFRKVAMAVQQLV